MENLLFNMDSVEVSYGDNLLNSIIQIDERIADIDKFTHDHIAFNDFEKRQMTDRLNKLIELNHKIKQRLDDQTARLNAIKQNL